MRHEPPTIEEAIAAARGMTADRDEQVEIAAGLIGVAADQVRLSLSAKPLVAKAQPPRARSTFVVLRKSLARPAEARPRPDRSDVGRKISVS